MILQRERKITGLGLRSVERVDRNPTNAETETGPTTATAKSEVQIVFLLIILHKG